MSSRRTFSSAPFYADLPHAFVEPLAQLSVGVSRPSARKRSSPTVTDQAFLPRLQLVRTDATRIMLYKSATDAIP